MCKYLTPDQHNTVTPIYVSALNLLTTVKYKNFKLNLQLLPFRFHSNVCNLIISY